MNSIRMGHLSVKNGTYIVYKEIRRLTLGRSLPALNFVEYPPGLSDICFQKLLKALFIYYYIKSLSMLCFTIETAGSAFVNNDAIGQGVKWHSAKEVLSEIS